jgi:aldose 1-epimerase
MKLNLIITLTAIITLSCTHTGDSGTGKIALLSKGAFEYTLNGKQIDLYTLNSGKGLIVQISNFGARIVSLWFPDKNGRYDDLIAGYDSIGKYIHPKGNAYFGATVGRYANRIAKGVLILNGKSYLLSKNLKGNCIHGGADGFNTKVWSVTKAGPQEVRMKYVSPDGENGFPGMVTTEVTFRVTPANELHIEYTAQSDKPTVISLTNHAFFNLKGCGNGTITDNLLTIDADSFTPVDSAMLPTGEMKSVTGTPFDFRKPTSIATQINKTGEQLKYAHGFDHNWILNRRTGLSNEPAVSLYEPHSGRLMEIRTNQPGIQIYTGNHFNGSYAGKYGKPVRSRESIAIEPQFFPDSPNHPDFPPTVIMPGSFYRQHSVYTFRLK